MTRTSFAPAGKAAPLNRVYANSASAAKITSVRAGSSASADATASSCACGGGCPRCRKAPAPQAKLRVSQPGDVLEREADRVAQQVLRVPESYPAQAAGIEQRASPVISRAPTNGAASSASAAISGAGEMFQSPGQALDAATRAFFEPRLGRDLGNVRVHTGADARAFADDLHARAVTYGPHIGFGAGESPADRGLLAHELVHTFQQHGAHAALIQRTPRVANQSWTVDHSDVAGLDEDIQINVAVQYLGVNQTLAKLYSFIVEEQRSQWAVKKGLYVRALDFLRDNRHRFDVPDVHDMLNRALDYCDRSSATATALTDAFYEGLLTSAVYSAGPGTATFRHSSGTTYSVPGRVAGSTDFAPSGDNALLRSNPTPDTTVTGGFSRRTDLLVSYGAQSGSVAARSVSLMLGRYTSNIPSRLRPFLATLATDPTLFSVLQRFLHDDNGRFLLQPVGLGGAHYTRARRPSIEVDPDLFPGSGARRESTQIGLRATLAHELYHYALDRADTALTEVGGEADHRLISIVQDRYMIVERLRAGQSPVSNDIDALNGYVGGDPKRALRAFIAADDRTGLRGYVRTRDFLDSTVFTVLVTAVGVNEARLSGRIGSASDFLLDPSQITDLAYLAALNGVILRKAFELAADISQRTGTPLTGIWGHADFQREIQAFISRLVGLASHNRRQGIVALAATI